MTLKELDQLQPKPGEKFTVELLGDVIEVVVIGVTPSGKVKLKLA
jgi:hypothetical protein